MVIRLTAANEGRAIVVIDESPRARYGVLSMGLNLMGVRALIFSYLTRSCVCGAVCDIERVWESI
jgi:hypothetical protein